MSSLSLSMTSILKRLSALLTCHVRITTSSFFAVKRLDRRGERGDYIDDDDRKSGGVGCEFKREELISADFYLLQLINL